MIHGLDSPGKCPDGFNCNHPGRIFECEPGAFASQNHLNCDDCSVGFFCQGGLEKRCESGTLANGTRQEGFNTPVSGKVT